MSEQQQKPKSFMQELDEWCDAAVINPLLDALSEDLDEVEAEVKRAIRAKVLESFRNGQLAGPRQPIQQGRKSFQR